MPITTAADDIYKSFFHCFSEIIRLDVSSESSARQRVHMKNHALFSSKEKGKKLKCLLLQFLFGTSRVKSTYGRDKILSMTTNSLQHAIFIFPFPFQLQMNDNCT